MAKYNIGIREVHVTTVQVELPNEVDSAISPSEKSEILKRIAASKHTELDTLDTEYSHTLDKEMWTIEKVG